MSVTTITFEVNVDDITRLTDEAVAQLWHIGQANPAPFGDPTACAFAECVGREIIRRWLQTVGPALWTHQGSHTKDAAPALIEITNKGKS